MTSELWVVAGPNGSGKTTWIGEALRHRPTFLYLGADAIAERMSPGSPEEARIAAGRSFLRQFEEALREGKSLYVESTLSGHTMTRFMQLARQEGYRIVISYLFLADVDLCIRRVHVRVRGGGHDVPVEDIRRRYGRSLRRFWTKYRFLADEWQLYYNAHDSFELTAGGTKDDLEITDEEAFTVFQDELNREI